MWELTKSFIFEAAHTWPITALGQASQESRTYFGPQG